MIWAIAVLYALVSLCQLFLASLAISRIGQIEVHLDAIARSANDIANAAARRG